MDFDDREDRDGVRLTWNYVPRSKLQHHRNVVPLAALYTPLNNKRHVSCLDASHMQRCRQCTAFFNAYAAVSNGVWQCQFCGFGNRQRDPGDGRTQSFGGNLATNTRPGNAGANSGNGDHSGMAANMNGGHMAGNWNGPDSAIASTPPSTVDYATLRHASVPPVFVYVVDVAFAADDPAFAALQTAVAELVRQLPANALVGLVSFAKHVLVHDLATPRRSYAFNGAKEYSAADVQRMLGLEAHTSGAMGRAARRLLCVAGERDYDIAATIERLLPAAFEPKSQLRALRATGCALNVAALAVHAMVGSGAGHVMCFMGGAATFGPGRVVGELLREPMRSHHDIERERAATSVGAGVAAAGMAAGMGRQVARVDSALPRVARDLYARVAEVMVAAGVACDMFVGCYDQVGVYEMAVVAARTGGTVVMCDSFATSMFRQSVARFVGEMEGNGTGNDDDADYNGNAMEGLVNAPTVALNATLECRVTRDFQVQGLVGHATALPVRPDRAASVLPTSVGEGNAVAWKVCAADTQSTYAVFLDKVDSPAPGTAFVQFAFHYEHPSGAMRVRVTTVPLGVVGDADGASLEAGFDQEAAVVALARAAVDKLQPRASRAAFSPADVVKQLDSQLVDFCRRFAVFHRGDMRSFRLAAAYAMVPQFLYHLRRSPLVRVFNSSPDETAYVCHVFMHEDVTNALIIIQPALLSYDIDTFGADDGECSSNADPEPVLLDSMSLGPTKILLLDTFFHILIYHGATVAQWRKLGYHNMEGYEHFRDFLEAPRREAMDILLDRFPLPRFIDCDEGGSQARFLMAKLNPSTSYSANPNHLYGGQQDVLTDDTSLQMFMDLIQRTVVGKK